MAKITGVKGPAFPEEKKPQISSKLAHNVGQVDKAKKIVFNTHAAGSISSLSGRGTIGTSDAADELALKNMLHWRI